MSQTSKMILIAIVAALIGGGGVVVGQKANVNSTNQAFQQQIFDLQADHIYLRDQLEQFQAELARQKAFRIQIKQNFQPKIHLCQNNNQQDDQSGNIENACKTLIKYFDLLYSEQYSEAIAYHGSGYDYLRDWNSGIDQDNYEVLLKNGCELNGLQCFRIKDILEQEQVSPIEFKFIVQFEYDDGSLLKFGPCCGATEEQMPIYTDFEYVVKLVGGGYVVATQPIYRP